MATFRSSSAHHGCRVSSLAVGCLLACFALTACSREIPMSLKSGTYYTSEHTAAGLPGVALAVDLETSQAQLRKGTQVVKLNLQRVPEQAKWIKACKAGVDHVVVEYALIEPSRFTIDGHSFSYDRLAADCGGEQVRLRNSDRAGHWHFNARKASKPKAVPTPSTDEEWRR